MTPAASSPAGARRRPGRPPGKGAEPGARRAEYLEAAMDAIRAVGPTATMTEIAERAGMSKPVLYDHFGDRLGLTVAVASSLIIGNNTCSSFIRCGSRSSRSAR